MRSIRGGQNTVPIIISSAIEGIIVKETLSQLLKKVYRVNNKIYAFDKEHKLNESVFFNEVVGG